MRHVLLSIFVIFKYSLESDINDSNLSCGPLNATKFSFGPLLSFSYIYDRLTRTTKANFICNNGSTLSYSPNYVKFTSVNCINGSWYTTAQPICTLRCTVPPLEIENGKMFYFSGTSTQQLFYLCDEGYMIAGGFNFDTCYGGVWSQSEIFTCVPIPDNITMAACKPLRPKNFTKFTYSDELNHGSVATFKCSKGYHLIRNNSEAYCVDGTFLSNGNLPQCVYDKCSMPNLTNGLIALFPNDRKDYPMLVIFTCLDGHELSGNFWSLCKRGNWRPKITASCSMQNKYMGK